MLTNLSSISIVVDNTFSKAKTVLYCLYHAVLGLLLPNFTTNGLEFTSFNTAMVSNFVNTTGAKIVKMVEDCIVPMLPIVVSYSSELNYIMLF